MFRFRRRAVSLGWRLVTAGVVFQTHAEAPTLTASMQWMPPDEATSELTAAELDALEHRREAHRADAVRRGARDTHDLVLDEGVTALPYGIPGETSAVFAVDGDDTTYWRGTPGAAAWLFTLPFVRPVHAALVRAVYGDASTHGIPVVYHWEYLPPEGEQCTETATWQRVPNSEVDDREPNQFVYGPNHVHARRQALFMDVDACALRLVVTEAAGKELVLRELHVLEGAPSLLRNPRVEIASSGARDVLLDGRARGAIDGTYKTLWMGEPGREQWTLTVRLPEAREIDRIALTLGLDAVSIPRPSDSGRTYVASHLPIRYSVEVSPDDDVAHLKRIEKAAPPLADDHPLPLRRRLVRLDAPVKAKLVRLVVTEATGPTGERGAASAAPVVRELGLYSANDGRPVVREPLFLSVNANPSALTRRGRFGEYGVDAQFARDAYTRLRRAIVGFDSDTGWIPDVSKKHDIGAGRFLESIEGDDPLLDAPLLLAMSPPPTLILSGSLNWDFGDNTERPPPHEPRQTNDRIEQLHEWNVLARASDPDRGMGQLAGLVRDRALPMVGICGGAHILAVLEATRFAPDAPTMDLVDRIMVRNSNELVRTLLVNKDLSERAWWYDGPALDRSRPSVVFDPRDRLWGLVALDGSSRTDSRELPLSHVDMLRMSAFSSVLSGFRVSATSSFCSSLVHENGPEATTLDPTDPNSRCVRIPQTFRTVDPAVYPLIGFQFHPEQRDFPRLAEGSPMDARGDAMNVFANAIDLVLESYVRLYWPDA